jgi:hypothetical protein
MKENMAQRPSLPLYGAARETPCSLIYSRSTCLFNPHKNGLIDKQRLNGDRWNRWVALGLNSVSKKSGGHYQKDDRVSVFRISREGSESVKNALEMLLEQS